MSKRKYKSGDPLTWFDFLRMNPTTIIYDNFAHRATQAGIVQNMPYILVLRMIDDQRRYSHAIRIEEPTS